jgi:uncharacterized protein (DUF983 family)
MPDEKLQARTGAPVAAGIAGRCPRCGRGKLFKGPFTLDINPACSACSLDFRFIDSGDGPAVFAIFALGVIVLGLALIVESWLSPPFWVHVVLWGPITLGLAFGMLRPLKGWLIAEQYRHKAGEAGALPQPDRKAEPDSTSGNEEA